MKLLLRAESRDVIQVVFVSPEKVWERHGEGSPCDVILQGYYWGPIK
jgi:hypothetical protein